MVSGPGLSEGIRLMLKGNADLDSYALQAILDRLDATYEPIPTHVAPHHALFSKDGPLPDGMEWCLPDTGVSLRVPNIEGLVAYFDAAGLTQVHVAVDRRYIELIEDPGSSWPLDNDWLTAILTSLGISIIPDPVPQHATLLEGDHDH